jgi:hypothetical protein
MPERFAEGMSIVLVGRFNPAIFHPAWFVSEGLLPEMPEGAVQLGVAHPQFTSFEADWLRFQVDDQRLEAGTADPSAFDPLRDLVLSSCRLLRHTPVTAAGVNTNVHFRLSAEVRDHVLQRFAPPQPWQEALPGAALLTSTVTAPRDDGFAGALRLTVEPSAKVEPGVYVHLNDHHDLDREGEPRQGADAGIEVLAKTWEDILQRSRRILSAVVTTT